MFSFSLAGRGESLQRLMVWVFLKTDNLAGRIAMCVFNGHTLSISCSAIILLFFVGHVNAELKPGRFCEIRSEIAKSGR